MHPIGICASRGSRPASDGRTVRHGRALFLLAQLRRDRRARPPVRPAACSSERGAFQLYELYLYPPGRDARVARVFAEELERRLPAARLLYWT
jgi:hypothetical protein